jgi:hypothetical protein
MHRERIGEGGWVNFRDRELGSVCLQRLKMDSAWERSSLGDDIRYDIRGSLELSRTLLFFYLSLSHKKEPRRAWRR